MLANSPTPATSRQIGLFIGTFDPVTNGHIKCANRAIKLLDELWFCPNPDNPKCKRVHLPLADRIQMLKLAIQGKQGFRVYVRDKNPYIPVPKKGKPRSLLIREVHRKYRTVQFWIVIGGDKLNNQAYVDPEAELKRTGHIIFKRASLAHMEVMRRLDLFILLQGIGSESSSEVKERLADGLPVDDVVPRSVAKYIHSKGLYAR